MFIKNIKNIDRSDTIKPEMIGTFPRDINFYDMGHISVIELL